jgi:hypothetical protein
VAPVELAQALPREVWDCRRLAAAVERVRAARVQQLLHALVEDRS